MIITDIYGSTIEVMHYRTDNGWRVMLQSDDKRNLVNLHLTPAQAGELVEQIAAMRVAGGVP